MKSHVWMGVGLLAGIVLGLVTAATGSPLLHEFAGGLKPVGTLFLNLLSMVVIPLVAAALFTGIAGLGDTRALGRLGVRTLGFYFGTMLLAVAIGFGVAALVLPLGPLTPDQQAALRAAAGGDQTFVRHAAEQIPSGARFLVELIPTNPVRAAADGNLLPLIVFTAIFGVASAALPDDKRAALTGFGDAVTQALIRIVRWVLWLAPFGIFALVAPAVAEFGWSLVRAMAVFVVAVIVGLFVFIAAVYFPCVRWGGRLTVNRFLQAALPSMAMAFSTTSSLATLPTMMDAADNDLRLPRTVSSLALPLGASINRSGSALYQACAVIFIAQIYGVPLGGSGIFLAGAAVFLASLTVAAVPSASVVSLVPAFSAVGLPLAGLTLLIGLDRVPDMFRTMTNVTGDLVGAAVVSRLEGAAPP